MIELGYACINETLSKQGISVNNGMIKRTFQAKGVKYASELALKNITNLYKLIEWNEQNNINLYRFSSDMFPWASEYSLKSLPDYQDIRTGLEKVGKAVKEWKHTIEYHPGPFTVLASDKQEVIDKSIRDLEHHAEIFDLCDFERNHNFTINIHVGTSRGGDKNLALKTWINSYHRLSESVKKRITLENDDKESMYTVQDLYQIYQEIGVPIVFDSLHFSCHNSGYTYDDTFKLAYSTWDTSITPLVHHSSAKKLWEDKNISSNRDHAGYIYEPFENVGLHVRTMLECKQKEIALLKYRQDYM